MPVDISKETLIELLKTNTCEQIGKQYNTSKTTITKLCHKLGIKLTRLITPEHRANASKSLKGKKHNVHGTFYCKYCNKMYTTRGGCTQHEVACKQNPNRIERHTSEETKALLSQRQKDYIANNKEKHRQSSIKGHQNRTEEQKQAFRDKQQQTWTKEKRAEQSERLTEIYKDNQELRDKIGQGVKQAINSEPVANHLREVRKNRYAKLYENPEEAAEYFRQKAITIANNRKNNLDKGQDSSWEKIFEDFLTRLNIPFERNIPLNYIDSNNKPRTTLIDYKVNDLLFEIKGPHLLKGIFTSQTRMQDKIKVYKENHVILITSDTPEVRQLIGAPNSKRSNGLKYLNKCPQPLIGIDIKLFNNPYFPYAIDRPPCFYDVKVDKKPSIKEAWSNEKLRWKMINNRIQYAGGFIDSHSIINALNITRTCKQPSWFHKNYAKELINKYITTNTIVDGFAGYGARYDAAIELNKTYYGIDLNKELVDWHIKQGRNISYQDANTWSIPINEPYSVFICPPYTDYEVYFDGQDIEKTQEDWLDVMRKNFPDAKEYLMVCKIVNKYKDNIVEEKANNGVIGKNVEKVVLIKNDKD